MVRQWLVATMTKRNTIINFNQTLEMDDNIMKKGIIILYFSFIQKIKHCYLMLLELYLMLFLKKFF